MIQKAIIIIVIFNTIATGAPHISHNKGINVLDSSQEQLTINFQPQEWSLDTLFILDDQFLKVDFYDASFEGMPGNPLLPTMNVIIGIPPEAEISFSILESSFFEKDGKLCPQCELMKGAKLSSYRYFLNETIYLLANDYPGKLVEISQPKFIRDQRIIVLKFFPIQFNPVSNLIKFYKSITVRINFHFSPGKQSTQRLNTKEDDFYKNFILNYEQSRNWRFVRDINIKKIHDDNRRWFKIYIKEEGIYKLTGKMLQDYGVPIESINPAYLKVFNNGGRELSREIDVATVDSLIENAIQVEDGGDGKFDKNDNVLFYGRSVNNWTYDALTNKYRHYINHYEDQNVYWLTWDDNVPAKRMQSIDAGPDDLLEFEPYFIDHYYFEQDIQNFMNSGYDWFSRTFTPGEYGSEYSFAAEFNNVVAAEALFNFRFLSWSFYAQSFTISINNQILGTTTGFRGKKFFEKEFSSSGLITSGYNTLKIKYSSPSDSSEALLDWFEIHYPREFVAKNDYLKVYLPEAANRKNISISNFSTNEIRLFDVTDFSAVKQITNTITTTNEVQFAYDLSAANSHTLIALTSAAFKTPTGIEEAEQNQLRNTSNGADYIIITHDDFYDAILPLAQHRENNDSLKTMVVKTSQIYNEFSWGLFDPTAIRDFIKYAYDNWSIPPHFILLCGDGDYDYKNRISQNDKNWVPTYETEDLSEDDNRTCDDWFVCVSGSDSYPDLAIGRLPVRSVAETNSIVRKLIAYDTAPFITDTGIDDWRNIITLIADDVTHKGGAEESGELIHTNDTEYLAANYLPGNLEKKKLFLCEYPEKWGASNLSAISKPEATEALINLINNGSLIINYLGHGNTTTLSDEYILYSPRDFNRINGNGDKLALWFAGTCEFARFDDPSQQCLAEDLVVTPEGGAIAVISSTRLAYAHENGALNRCFIERLFQNHGKGRTARIGTALQKAKIDNTTASTNDEKYVLLGDPTMRLAYRGYRAKINAVAPDTIKALTKLTAEGFIQKQESNYSDFQGKILLKAFDSEKQKTYISPVKSYKLNYNLPGNTIFRGTGTIQNGDFKFEFFVPKDVTYGGSNGRLSVYFANDEINGSGSLDNLPVGGSSLLIDNIGPEIDIGLQNENFFNEGYTNQFPVFKIWISDSTSGINITGDIGHHITMIVDDDNENKTILTDLFQYDERSCTRGSIVYDFNNKRTSNLNGQNGLAEGLHQVKIKAWDNANNSSTALAEFHVVPGSDLTLWDVLNFPNPFSSGTTFCFFANHDCMATIKIFSVAGRLLYKFDDIYTNSNELAQLDWEGRDQDGDVLANGVYFYKVIAKAKINGVIKTKEIIQKLVIMR